MLKLSALSFVSTALPIVSSILATIVFSMSILSVHWVSIFFIEVHSNKEDNEIDNHSIIILL